MHPHQRGIALVLVLWVMALLTVLMGMQLRESRIAVRLVRASADAQAARAAAEGAVSFCLARLLEPAVDPALIDLGAGVSLGAARTWCRAEVESGKVDINRASPELLERIVAAAGAGAAQAHAIAAAIADYRDADSSALPDGAEEADYAALRLPYGPKNAPFDAIDELLQVPGVTPALYADLAPVLTVHSGLRTVDRAFAAPWVAAALGQPQKPSDVRREVPGQGVFTVRGEARQGEAAAGVAMVVRLGSRNDEFQVLAWREGPQGLL